MILITRLGNMRELSMFCKIKNLVTISALALMVSTTNNLYAQGLVTLSEEAMFDDAEDATPKEAPAPNLAVDNSDDALGNLAPKNNVANQNVPASATLPSPQKSELPIVKAEPEQPALFNEEETGLDNDVFEKMSDLEKQTALLNLELRRERVRNEIEAIKNQRKQAEQQEIEAAEEKARKQKEWEKEQERKILEEQQKLRELDIQFEKTRQEHLLNAYKNEMLKANQEWIAHEGSLYKQIDELKKEKQELFADMKKKLLNIKSSATNVTSNSNALVAAYRTELENKDIQISVLKARNEAQERELEKRNPFAEGATEGMPTSITSTASTDLSEIEVEDIKLINQYAVMEIRGQNGELIAKLINQDGMPFYVKKGTALQSGHTISEITSTYVKAERNGIADFLYFAAGGILPKEQPISSITPRDSGEASADNLTSNTGGPSFVSSVGVPGMGKSMIAR